ncbi:MAG: RidA family protein [Myxococcales bacterium]|nr:RidA family protein [Myxococcales bacterium]
MAIAVNPDTLAPPKGYANGLILPAGRMLFVAGQIGWDREMKIVSDSFADQFDKALENVIDVVREAGGTATDIGRITMYVTDKEAYRAATRAVGEAYRRHMGSHYPAMALVEVAGLLEPGALVEIEATAVLPS